MAKIEGTQNIPSELLDLYRATITEQLPNNAVRKRYPYRLRLLQKFGYKVSEAQKKQRARFEAIIQKFRQLSFEERKRWYEARPPWRSLLWYYNYFMLSGLLGNAVIGDKGGGVIKNIYHYTFTLPSGTPQEITVNINTVDPKKAIGFLYGAAGLEAGPADAPYCVEVYPIIVSIGSTYVVVKASMYVNFPAECSISIIEYI